MDGAPHGPRLKKNARPVRFALVSGLRASRVCGEAEAGKTYRMPGGLIFFATRRRRKCQSKAALASVHPSNTAVLPSSATDSPSGKISPG
jgi:hypothetical protein